jgi:hypothetical protein
LLLSIHPTFNFSMLLESINHIMRYQIMQSCYDMLISVISVNSNHLNHSNWCWEKRKGDWSSDMILTLDARNIWFNSRIIPFFHLLSFSKL